MPIYMIEAPTWEAIRDLEFGEGMVYKKRYRRAVVFCRDELTFPTGYRVERVEQCEEPGQIYEHACSSWLGKLTVIDDLVAEHAKLTEGLSVREQRKLWQQAEDRWRKAREGLRRAEEALLEAEDVLRRASADFVRAHGRGPFGLHDTVWYLSCALEPYPHVSIQDLGKQWARKLRPDKRRAIRQRRERR